MGVAAGSCSFTGKLLLSVSARLPPGQTFPWRETLHRRLTECMRLLGLPRANTTLGMIDSRHLSPPKVDVGGRTSNVKVSAPWLVLFLTDASVCILSLSSSSDVSAKPIGSGPHLMSSLNQLPL